MTRPLSLGVVILVIAAAPLVAQTNLLVNGSFDTPALPNGDCSKDPGAIDNWTGTGMQRNGDWAIAPCPRAGDVAHLSMQGWGNGTLYATQTVSGLTPGQLYTLAGWWYKQHSDPFGVLTCTAELRNGPAQDSPLIASKTVFRYGGQDNQWSEFSVSGTLPAGSTVVTVVLRGINSGGTGFALHADDVRLVEGNCFSPPTIASITPGHGVRGTTVSDASIAGSNFVAGQTSVKLTRGDAPEIVATNVVVSGTASLTCSFNLSTAVLGPYNVVLSVAGQGCPTDTLPDGFLVILPEFSNGSFELPTAPGACPPVPLAGAPTDWSFREISLYGYGNALYRDGDIWAPSCPPLDGLHYATSSSTNDGAAGAEATIYQTFAVTPGLTYAFSGSFAGGGANTVTMELRDGSLASPALNTSTIHTPASGSYDWTFNTVSGTPSSGMMTAVWHIDLAGAGPHATHADGLAVEVCNTPVDLTAISPNVATNEGPISITNLAGAGFAMGSTPVVQLIKGNTVLTATEVNVLSPNQITCSFDLTGAPSGKYVLRVKQGGCSATIPADNPGAFLVVAAEFVNGGFEDPGADLNCGPPPVPTGGLPTGWNSDANLIRDGNAPVPPSCPSPADGHYGSMSRAGGTLNAWQTVKVLPGQQYTFSGQFAGSADCIIRLLDGDELGMVLASSPVFTDGDGGAWQPASVAATALSEVMTVMWTIENTTAGAPGGHADGLTLTSSCHPIWADYDDDNDVDMDDFSMLQRCLTTAGTEPIDPYCRCFDRAAPAGTIDDRDIPLFTLCASGPNIPWTTCAP